MKKEKENHEEKKGVQNEKYLKNNIKSLRGDEKGNKLKETTKGK